MPHTSKPLPLLSEKDIARFWSKVNKQGPDDCWPWLGGLSEEGYGKFKAQGRTLVAHRVAWELENGPPDDPTHTSTCHSCDERYAKGDKTYRRCCNPAHSWPGSAGDNLADARKKGRQRWDSPAQLAVWDRSIRIAAQVAAQARRDKTHCVNGHPLSGNNLYIDLKRGKRQCHICRRAAEERRQAKHKAY